MMTKVFNVTNGDRPDVPNTAIVITDGRSTYDHNLTIPYAEEAKRRGIRMLGLCLLFTDITFTPNARYFLHIICLLS